MAVIRTWVTVTPEGKDALQASLDGAGLGAEVAAESWTAYPPSTDPQVIRLYWIGWQGQHTVGEAIEAVAAGHASAARYRRGPTRPTSPAMTYEQLIAQFPDPDSGPVPQVIVKQEAAWGAHYRDFGIAGFDPNVARASSAGKSSTP